MKFEIEITDERLIELVENEIIKTIVHPRDIYEDRRIRKGVNDGIGKGVKEYIYKNKDEIIEKAIDRASKEMVRKGLPKFIEKSLKWGEIMFLMIDNMYIDFDVDKYIKNVRRNIKYGLDANVKFDNHKE